MNRTQGPITGSGEEPAHGAPPAPNPDAHAARQRLLELRLQRQHAADTGLPVARAPADGAAMLTHAQEGLWFLDRMTGPSGVYNVEFALRLRGALDVAALERSVRALAGRHASLRTAFLDRHGVPVQVVRYAVDIDVPLVEADGPEAQSRLLREGAARPFDLSRAPLLRAQLLRCSDSEHVLQLVVHHIVSDGWSSELMVRELGALYAAQRSGGAPALTPLPFQFADYARWQRERLAGAHLEQLLSHWRERLSGLDVLQLPTDRPRPAQPDHTGAVDTLVVSAESLDRLRALARRHDATLFMVLAAAFDVLLMRYSGQTDVAVGSPVAGRDRAEFEALVGYFVNTVVLRTDVSGNPSFERLLARVRQTALDAYAHQELPFDRLVSDLAPRRDPGRNPLFEVMINHFAASGEPVPWPGLGVSEVDTPAESAKFVVTLYLDERADHLRLRLVARRELFCRDWGTVCLAQYVDLLRQIADAPQRQIHDYSLLTAQTRHLLADPAVEMAAPSQVPVARQVLDRARAEPSRIALSQGGRSWTYAELTRRASSLAHTLQARGVARGDVVAIEGPRSLAVVGSMLAVSMCAAVFLTIDPALPRERRRQLVREAGAVLTLAIAQPHDSTAPSAAGTADMPDVLWLDAQLDGVDLGAVSEPVALQPVADDDPAYVFFTSGSTGRPKAVLGCHKGLSQFLHWQRRAFDIGANDRVSQLTALSFDSLLRDVFLPLTSGGTICVPREQDMLEPLRWLRDERVTVVHTTPSLLQSWLAGTDAVTSLPDLRWLFLSGELLTDGLVKQWRQRCGTDARIVNLYGPTETTMIRCSYVVPDEVEPGVQPIGTPIDATQALVMSAEGRLCGVNEPGEIVLRTPFRCLGYLNLADETRARFRRNPFRDDAADLLYYTGDRGRLRADGLLAISGRLDDQVKIRGVRVEPGEVTAVLASHEAVHSCIVVARSSIAGDRELVGYVVTAAGCMLDSQQARDYLRGRLPSALVPGAYVFLDALPLLPNGKVDRAALPPPQRQEAEAGHVAARTALEQALVDIWCELLGVARVGVHDDFFDLGGDSLKGMQMLARVRARHGIEIAISKLFSDPTIAALASGVEDLEDLQSEIDQMSDAEVARLLAQAEAASRSNPR